MHEDWLRRFDEAGRSGRFDTATWQPVLADDHVQTDHRRFAWEPVVGRDAMVAVIRSMADMGGTGGFDRRLVWQRREVHVAHEVLRATTGEGIRMEVEWWTVRRIDDGVAASCDIFEDEASALAFASAATAARP